LAWCSWFGFYSCSLVFGHALKFVHSMLLLVDRVWARSPRACARRGRSRPSHVRVAASQGLGPSPGGPWLACGLATSGCCRAEPWLLTSSRRTADRPDPPLPGRTAALQLLLAPAAVHATLGWLVVVCTLSRFVELGAGPSLDGGQDRLSPGMVIDLITVSVGHLPASPCPACCHGCVSLRPGHTTCSWPLSTGPLRLNRLSSFTCPFT
jgi:hypothetical protein